MGSNRREREGGRDWGKRKKEKKRGGGEDLECVAWLASHELEGAVEEGSGVADGGAIVVDEHNVEQLRLAGHGWPRRGGRGRGWERREERLGLWSSPRLVGRSFLRWGHDTTRCTNWLYAASYTILLRTEHFIKRKQESVPATNWKELILYYYQKAEAS